MNKNVFLSYLEFIWIKTRQIHWKKTHFVNTEQLQDIRSEKLETSEVFLKQKYSSSYVECKTSILKFLHRINF